MATIIDQVSDYVLNLLAVQLPPELSFHNIDHTKEVVKTTADIAAYAGLSDYESELLTIAAWFHDTGYTITYKDHEEAGVRIASAYLLGQGYPADDIEQVRHIILSTKFPQKPTDKLGCVICDADLAHLAKKEYSRYATRLRNEWAACIHQYFTDREWDTINLVLLRDHRYFTDYGKKFLEQGKAPNLQKLINRLS